MPCPRREAFAFCCWLHTPYPSRDMPAKKHFLNTPLASMNLRAPSGCACVKQNLMPASATLWVIQTY